MTREEAIDLWQDANFERGCSCHISTPCSFCVDGYSLPMDEYLELLELDGEFEPEVDEVDEVVDAYERAMRGI